MKSDGMKQSQGRKRNVEGNLFLSLLPFAPRLIKNSRRKKSRDERIGMNTRELMGKMFRGSQLEHEWKINVNEKSFVSPGRETDFDES